MNVAIPEQVDVVRADLWNSVHQQAICELLDCYMRHPMGAHRPLDPTLRPQLIEGLQSHPGTMVVVAFQAQRPVGLAICFRGFSTFAARPLVNIHDLVVVPEAQQQGVGTRLLQAVEGWARELGCCRLTLEVRADNRPARRVYQRFGFCDGATADEAMSFWTKSLEDE